MVLMEVLHARPAALVAAAAGRHQATIRVGYQERFVDAKSILGLISLGAPAGASLTIQAEGNEAAGVVDELVRLLKGSPTQRSDSRG